MTAGGKIAGEGVKMVQLLELQISKYFHWQLI